MPLRIGLLRYQLKIHHQTFFVLLCMEEASVAQGRHRPLTKAREKTSGTQGTQGLYEIPCKRL